MLRRLSLVLIAAAVTVANAATTLSLRSDQQLHQQLDNVTELSFVEQSVNTEKPSDWIALPLCAVSSGVYLFTRAYLAHIAPLYCANMIISDVTQAN